MKFIGIALAAGIAAAVLASMPEMKRYLKVKKM